MNCVWCDAGPLGEGVTNCYWVMPDGKAAVQITEIPAIHCSGCGLYVAENIAQKVEEALYWKDVSALGAVFRYDELMNAPSITKSIFK